MGEQQLKNKVVCECNHLTTFGSNLLVAPNPIDFSSAFGKFKRIGDNFAVLVLIISILIIFWCSLFVLRRVDKKDEEMWKMRSLLDNSALDRHHYALIVRTGYERNAGTDSDIKFVFMGEHTSSNIRTLYDGFRENLKRSSINHFHMTTRERLSEPSSLRVWINPTDKTKSPSWFLEEVVLVDVSTMTKHYFYVHSWLTKSSPCIHVQKSQNEEITAFKRLWPMWLRNKLSDDHLWLSIFSRPTRSHFTRVQRAACCLCMIATSMIASAMFYQRRSEETDLTYKLGPLIFSVQQLWIGTISAIIVVPINFIIMTIFKKTRKNSEAKLKSFTLPPTFTYIAWILLIIAIFSSFFFVLLYSLEWGKTKSEQWLTSMLISFTQSVIVIQPFKVKYCYSDSLFIQTL